MRMGTAVLITSLLFSGLAVRSGAAGEGRPAGDVPAYTADEISRSCERFHIWDDPFHFPAGSFLEAGYAPPGGYVKDFGMIRHDGRYHLFHIDGRPEERCTVSGNEIHFGHASTDDLRRWIRHRMPLAIGDRPWEDEHVWAPFVAARGGRFHMFYMASGRATGGAITYASSDDLETWTKWAGGPIRTAAGRDPFIRLDGDTVHLYFTANAGGIGVVTSEDLVTWSDPARVMVNPARREAESSSVHRRGGRWVLWYNDYLHVRDPSGDFRAVYIHSDDPLRFDPAGLKVFDFTTPLPTRYGKDDWVEKRPIPVGIELLREGKDSWLVAYFRWHLDRFRLFFGELRWDAEPARIDEIVTGERLREALGRIGG